VSTSTEISKKEEKNGKKENGRGRENKKKKDTQECITDVTARTVDKIVSFTFPITPSLPPLSFFPP
jgi:hypothetical protein